MSLHISVIDPTTEKLTSLEIDANDPIENVKALIEVEFGIPSNEQVLQFQNKILNGNDQMSKYGVQNNDLITVFRKQRQPQNPLVAEAQKIKKYYEEHPDQLQFILHQQPELANAVLSDDIQQLVALMQRKQQDQLRQRMNEMQRIQQLESDPFNPDNQRLIEEEIKKHNIQHNLELAQEYIPENFGQITMLYVEITVNKHPVQAFVDSGAQSTIMSKACAERCNIMRLVDPRFAGMALGVGTQKILGRVHMIDIQIMDKVGLKNIFPIFQKFIPCSITILDGDSIDFLLGLDMLRRFQCSIDLQKSKLIFPTAGLEVPFLSEGEIKKTFSIAQEQELYNKHQEEQQLKNQQQQQQQPQGQSVLAPQQQAPRPQQQQQQPQAQQSQFTEQQIQPLINMGFTRAEAIQALRATRGNTEMAASLLTQQKYGF